MSIEDRAQEHEAMLWENRNMHRRRLLAPAAPGDTDYGPEFCEECEDPMPAVRRSYRCILCTPCQAALEIATQRR